MLLTMPPRPAPLETNQDGDVLIRGTRVPLGTVVCAFNEGKTAEEIVQQFTSLNLSDVYLVIGYYLSNQQEVDHYLSEREKEALEIRKENEKRFPSDKIRERLMARKREKVF